MNFKRLSEALQYYANSKIDLNQLPLDEIAELQKNLQKNLIKYIDNKDFTFCNKNAYKNDFYCYLFNVIRKIDTYERNHSENYNERKVISTSGNLGEAYFLEKLKLYGVTANNLPPKSPFTFDMKKDDKFLDSKVRFSKSKDTMDFVTLYYKEYNYYKKAIETGIYNHNGLILETNVTDLWICFLYNYDKLHVGEAYINMQDIIINPKVNNNTFVGGYDIPLEICIDFDTFKKII